MPPAGSLAPAASSSGGLPADAPGEDASDRQKEIALVERARRGDLAAYEAIVERYEEVAFRLAYLLVRDGAEAEEVCDRIAGSGALEEARAMALQMVNAAKAELPARLPWGQRRALDLVADGVVERYS
jgi:geranylgeranyl pyrophosphate synthase